MEIVIEDTAKAGLSDNEQKYLRLLEFYDLFGQQVNVVRERLPGVKFIDGKPLIESADGLLETLAVETSELLKKCKIPGYLSFSIQDLIIWGRVISGVLPISIFGPAEMPSSFTMTREEIEHFKKTWRLPRRAYKTRYKYNRQILSDTKYIESAKPVIVINKKIKSPTEFSKYVKDNWAKIKETMADYEEVTGLGVLAKISTQELAEDIKLLRLRREGLSNTKIAEKVDDTEGRIKKRLQRMERRLSAIGFKGTKSDSEVVPNVG